MAGVQLQITGLDKLISDLGSMADKPDFKAIARFESALASEFAATQAKVHIMTGGLKASGITFSSFDGSQWHGTIEYATHPGIFELARGDKPSLNHPEGGHNFFEQLEKTAPAEFGQSLTQWFEDELG